MKHGADERVRLEASLRESEARFRILFEQAPVGMIVTGLDGRFRESNPAFQAFLGYSAEELRGMGIREVTHPSFLAQSLEGLQALIAGEMPSYEMEKMYVRKDGQEVWGRLRATPLRDVQGRIQAMLTIVGDITERRRHDEERRRFEEEIQHALAQESLGRLAGGLAHDMNNVLQAIQGMTSVLRERLEGDAEAATGLDLILNASRRGRDLVRDLTDFIRRDRPELGVQDLNALVRREVELLERTTLNRVELAVELQEDLPLVLGDASALGNALMNLCVNALDAMDGRGRITFRTRSRPDGRVELQVEDTGHGMVPEVLARALEPYFTTKPRGKGTGLGLPGVDRTMKAHGGTLEIRSAPGRGTRVSLRFPGRPGVALPKAEEVPGSARDRIPFRVLLVDDDELIRDSISGLLGLLGHRVLAACPDGAAGLSVLDARRGEVDIVFLDHNMPGLSGLETLKRLRARHPGLPVVFCSGQLGEDALRELKAYEGVRVLAKPYTLQDVRALLADLAEGRAPEGAAG